MWPALTVLVFISVYTPLCFGLSIQNDLVLSKLGSSLDLELSDAAFEVLQHLQKQSPAKSNDLKRSKRQTVNSETWTGFIPSLDQHRDQLVIDSITAVSSTQVCQGDQKVLWDATNHQKTHYAFAICGSDFYIYSVSGDSMQQLQKYSLDADAVDLKHVKLYNNQKDELVLLVLVLLPRELKICYLNKGACSPFLSQELIGVSQKLEVFYLDKIFYTLLARKLPDDRIEIGLLNIFIKDGDISINYVLTRTMSGLSLLRLCVIFNQAFLFFWDSFNNNVPVYIFTKQNWELFQIFDVSDVKMLECFRLGATHYVTIATAQTLVVYQFSEEIFELLQIEDREGITKILSLTPNTYRDEAMILVQGTDSSEKPFVDIYILDALTLTFKPKLGQSCPANKQLRLDRLPQTYNPQVEGVTCLASTILPDVSSAVALHIGKTLGLIIPYGQQSVLVSMETSLESVSSPVFEQRNWIGQRLERQQNELETHKVRAARLDEFLGGVVLYNSDANIQGKWKVYKLQVPALVTETDTKPEALTLADKNWLDSVDISMDDVQNKVQLLDELLSYIEVQLQGSLENGTIESVVFDNLLIDGSVVFDSLNAEKLALEQLNGSPVTKVLLDIVQKGSSRLVEGLKSIAGILSTNSLSATRINDVVMEDVISSVEDVVIRGNVNIQQSAVITGDLIVEGSLGGIRVPEGILTKDSQHGNLNFLDNIEVDTLQVEGTIDSVVVNEDVFASLVRNNSVGVTLENCRFDNVIVDGDIAASGSVCGVSLELLDQNIVHLNRDEVIKASKTITGEVKVGANLRLETINGLNFAEDFVRKTEDTQISGKKSFVGPVTVDTMGLSGYLNDKDLSNVITLSKDQAIPGTLAFNEDVSVSAGLDIGTLDGILFTDLAEKGIHPYLFGLGTIEKEVLFRGNLRVSEDLTVAGNVNGENLQETLADLVYSDETDVVITGLKTIEALKLDDLRISGLLNGFKFPDDFLTVSTDQDIPTDYIFEKPVSAYQVRINDQINGHNLNDLISSAIATKGDQTVTSSLRFENIVVEEELVVGKSINNVRAEDLVINGMDQTFTKPQTLVNAKFNSIVVDTDLIVDEEQAIDGVDISVLDQRRVTLSTDQEIDNKWTISSSTSFEQKLSFQTLNDLSVNDWSSMFVRRNFESLQTIEGRLEAPKLKTNSVETSADHGINGFDIASLNQQALNINDGITFDVDVQFNHLRCDSVQLEGLLNGYDVDEIVNDVVFFDDPQSIVAKKIFESLRVRNDIEADLVNGIKLRETYLLKSFNQTVTGPVNFLGTVRVHKDLGTNQGRSINGITHEDLFASQLAPSEIHEGDLEITRPTDIGKLFTDSVNDENWAELITNIALLNQSNIFREEIIFNGKLLLLGDVIISDRLNDENVEEFRNDVVLKDEDASITGLKTFQNRVKVQKLTISQLTADEVIPDISTASANAVYLNEDQLVEGEITFSNIQVDGDVQLQGTLNGDSFPEDFILLSTSQILPGTYLIEKLTSVGDIEMEDGATLNERDISEEFHNSWKIDEDCHLKGLKTFQGQVEVVTNVNVQGRINGFDLLKEVVPLDSDATIYGEPRLQSAIVQGNVITSSKTNDIDVRDFESKTLYTDTPIATQARWTFIKDVVTSGEQFLLDNNGTLNGLSVAALLNSGSTLTQAMRSPVAANEASLDQIQDEINLWLLALQRGFFKIDYFQPESSISLPFPVTSISFAHTDSVSLLLVGTASCSSFVFRKISTETEYSFYTILDNTGSVTKWQLLSLTSSSVYFVLLAKPSSSCPISGAKLWHFYHVSANDFGFKQTQEFDSSVKDIATTRINKQSYLYTAGTGLQEWFFRSGRLQLMKTSRMSPTMISVVTLNDSDSYISAWKSKPESLYSQLNRSSTSIKTDFNHGLQDVAKMHSFELDGDIYVAVAEKPEAIIGCRGLKIYSVIEHCCLELKQVLDVCQVTVVKAFKAGNYPDYYLAIGDGERVKIYQHKGVSGFQLDSTFETGPVNDVHVYEVEQSLHVAVATDQKIVLFKAVIIGA